jgi:S-disulfanyl-L-cysteine oxidoreductase SoxD
MRCSPSFLVLMMLLALPLSRTAMAQTPDYSNVGKAASPEEIHAWDISVSPEGKELPPGSGTAKEGATIYAQKCAACHGPTGAEGEPRQKGRRTAPILVGGKGTLASAEPVRTIGSFWPFATTVWDYIHRAMPMFQEGTLSADQVYALTAFLLFRNGIVQENAVMDAKSLPKVQMPDRNGFTPTRLEWKAPAGDPGRTP